MGAHVAEDADVLVAIGPVGEADVEVDVFGDDVEDGRAVDDVAEGAVIAGAGATVGVFEGEEGEVGVVAGDEAGGIGGVSVATEEGPGGSGGGEGALVFGFGKGIEDAALREAGAAAGDGDAGRDAVPEGGVCFVGVGRFEVVEFVEVGVVEPVGVLVPVGVVEGPDGGTWEVGDAEEEQEKRAHVGDGLWKLRQSGEVLFGEPVLPGAFCKGCGCGGKGRKGGLEGGRRFARAVGCRRGFRLRRWCFRMSGESCFEHGTRIETVWWR